MTQKPRKKSIDVLIIISIIGFIGTVITVIGNYNVEKLRQETELTRIALVSIATQGEAIDTAVPYITYTPYQTPFVTETPIPTFTISAPNTPSLTSAVGSLNIACTSEKNQIKVTWENLSLNNNLYLMTYAYSSNRYFAPTPISTKSGERTITISTSITEIAIVVLTGVTPATFPTDGVEKGNEKIIIDIQIQKPIPPTK